MYVILLKFGANKALAPQHMAGHKAWLQAAFDDGIFFASGNLQPALGGGILATADDRAAIEQTVQADPFVQHGIVEPEILEINPTITDPRLNFLQAG